ncbi:MAG: hypothetical protein ACKV0T_09770, partial [Planctomycetales bacterium]
PLHADLSVHVFGDSIGRIAAGPDGIVAIAASESRPLSSLDLDSGRRIEFPHGRYGNPLVALSQGRFVIQDVAGDFGVFVWTPGKSNVVRLEQISERWMENRCYDFGPNESLAYAVSLIDPKTCQSWPAIVNWDIRTGRKALVEFGREHYIDSLKCLADGTVIYNDSIQVGAWDPKSGRLRASPAGKWNSQSPFIVVGENQVLYVTRAGSASRDPGLCLWDPRSETTKLFGPDWVQIRPLGGDRVAISEPQLDHTSVWRITDKESHREGMLPVGAREFHPAPDGGVLYLSSQQTQEVMNSRLQPGSKQIELRIHLAYADSDRQRDAHLANWRELAPWDLRFTPDGRVYGGRDANRLYVLNPETGAVSSIPILPVTGGIARVDWLADGWLALWASDSDVVFNHPETGRRVPLRFGSTDHTAPADWLVRIDNENQQFAVSVWSPRTGRTAVMNDDRHLAKITSAQVFSDGWVISCSEDLNVKAWNLELGEVRTLMDCDAVPFAAEYPGSRALVSSKDGVVRLWDYREDSAQVLIAGHGIPGALALGDGRIVMPDKVGLSLFSPQGTKLCELPVEAIRFACVPTGNRIATASQIGVAVYEVE